MGDSALSQFSLLPVVEHGSGWMTAKHYLSALLEQTALAGMLLLVCPWLVHLIVQGGHCNQFAAHVSDRPPS